MARITFKPHQITKNLMVVLSPRARDVLERRHGLGKNTDIHTLESIGQSYGITRERVRQIENHGIQSIQKANVYHEHQSTFEELENAINELGGIVAEHDLLNNLSEDQSTKNHLNFLLVLGTPFIRQKENNSFHHRWHTNNEQAEEIEKALERVAQSLSEDELVSEEEVVSRFFNELDGKVEKNAEMASRWLSLSKVVGRNPLGEWGVTSSPNVRAKGIRDFAYLAVKRHGSPMHFREVAESIEELFNRKAHVATCHNELIKDNRFVLVGRGLYALTEWGYTAGVVKDVLRDILDKNGPLSRDEIIDKVRKERYVKDNTIVVNLQDGALFKKLPNGTYALVS